VNILIADDDATARLVLRMLLVQAGHGVTEAHDGATALALAASHPFQLILMDVQMPVMDGLEATRRIRERERGTPAHAPIFALTGARLAGDGERCLAAGADRYLCKPVNRAELFAAMAGLIGPAPRAGSVVVAPNTSSTGSSRCVPEIARLMADAGVDGDVARELAAAALARLPQTRDEIRQACARRDGAAMAWAAHTLVGSAALFDAEMRECAGALEAAARGGSWSAVPDLMIAMDRALARVCAELKTFIAEHDSSAPGL